jgi:hypothetical protein
LAALFVVSRIAGVPGAKEFVLQALGEANLQRHWAEDGLKSLDAMAMQRQQVPCPHKSVIAWSMQRSFLITA